MVAAGTGAARRASPEFRALDLFTSGGFLNRYHRLSTYRSQMLINAPPVAATPLRVSDLRLDPENPRLPEVMHRKSEAELLRYLYETAALDELALSFADNLYFAHEPVIVDQESRVVLEGNRRVATLKILLGLPEAGGLEFPDLDLPAKKKETLSTIPCFLVDQRNDVHAFLGFRHIGGIKGWSAEAKARYIYNQVRTLPAKNGDNAFDLISRRTGLEKQAVRQAYLAYALACEARDRGIAAAQKLFVHDERRFGVLVRLLVSKDVRQYLGLDSAGTAKEIEVSLRNVKPRQLKEVLEDLAPASGAPILQDSRDVTTYGRILLNDKARAEMRRSLDLEVARQIIDREKLPARLTKIRRQLELAADEVLDLGKLKQEERRELVQGLDAIEKALGKLRTVVRGTSAS